MLKVPLEGRPMTAPDSLLTIGAFARASRLSVKALRLYDDLGLLPPIRVDKGNGYRYYSPAQLSDARLISLLRQLELPLSDIRTILDAPSMSRPNLLRSYWTSAKAAFVRREELARYVFHQLQGGPNMTQFEVQTRSVPAQRIATLTVYVFVTDLPRTIEQGMQELHTSITSQGGTLAGVPFVIYHGEVNPDSDGPIEICQPYQGQLQPTGNVVLRKESAHTEAFVTLTKRQFEFPAVLRAYDAVAEYATANGRSSLLACREVYPYAWDSAGEADPVSEVAWPYIPAGEEQ